MGGLEWVGHDKRVLLLDHASSCVYSLAGTGVSGMHVLVQDEIPAEAQAGEPRSHSMPVH